MVKTLNDSKETLDFETWLGELLGTAEQLGNYHNLDDAELRTMYEAGTTLGTAWHEIMETMNFD